MLWPMIYSTFSNCTTVAILQDEETEVQRSNVSQAQNLGKGRARVGIQAW